MVVEGAVAVDGGSAVEEVAEEEVVGAVGAVVATGVVVMVVVVSSCRCRFAGRDNSELLIACFGLQCFE